MHFKDTHLVTSFCKPELINRYAKLQSRKAFLRDLIRTEENLIADLKDVVQYMWQLSTPETVNGRSYFHEYKVDRENLKQAKKRRKHLVELKLELKQEMLEVSSLLLG